MPCMILLIYLLVVVASVLSSVARAELRFDFGTENSPVAEGSERVTGNTRYSADRGHGWESSGQAGFDTSQPGDIPRFAYRGFISQPRHYQQFSTPLRRDGVESTQEMVFRVDVPNGEYRIHVIVGHLVEPLESLWVDCNEKTVGRNIAAAHRLDRNRGPGFGFFHNVRFTIVADEGFLRFRFYGDDEQFRRNMKFLKAHFPVTTDNQGRKFFKHPKKVFERNFDADDPMVFDPGQPFKKNSVLGLMILPAVKPPFRWDEARLKSVAARSPAAGKFAEAFNSGDLKQAEEILDRGKLVNPAETAAGYLFLTGHPGLHENAEGALIGKARRLLEQLPADTVTEEYIEDLGYFEEARDRFINRSRHARDRGEGGAVTQLKKSGELMRLIESDSPLVYKAMQYRGRAYAMRDPNRWTAPTGDCRRLFRKLLQTWPTDKFGLFYVRNVWEPDDDWHFSNHFPETAGAPDWARALRKVHGRILDVTEWWRKNKQQPDGSIGGGWGDDVEIVQFFGLYGFISEGASPETMALTNDLIEGMWNHSELDPRAGFCRPMADAEHSAEWSGDTLGLMVQLKYGDPVWLERAMKTAKLMRSLWMAPNEHGRLHFKANYFGAHRVGRGSQSNDSYINHRATRPAVMAHWYNASPTIAKLFTDWADAWLDAAMSPDRGKPRGVLPAEVGFPDGIIGGVDSPNWFTSTHPPGTVNYDFADQKYKAYITDLMMMAFDITRDPKYLEPFRLEAQLVRTFDGTQSVNAKPGSPAWTAAVLAGNAGGRRATGAVERWSSIQKRVNGSDQPPKILYEKEAVASRCQWVADYMEERWPNMTTETSATDRVLFPGIADPYSIMAGANGESIWQMAATYAGIGRDAVAFVQAADQRHLRILMYNFSSDPLKAAIIPWLLEAGGSYQVHSGADRNGDDAIDGPGITQNFVLDRRGQRCRVNLPPRTTTVVLFNQIRSGRGSRCVADLALTEQEVAYDSRWGEIEAVVHNIGSAPVEDIRIVFSEFLSSGRKQTIGESHIPYLAWPRDLEPIAMRVAVAFRPTKDTHHIVVEVDPDGQVDEITATNNEVRWTLRIQ